MYQCEFSWYNTLMTPKLTDEMRQALKQEPGRPVKVKDEQTQKIYVLVADDDFNTMVHMEFSRQLKVGFDQADNGEFVDWDPEKLKAEGREILQKRSNAS